VALDEGRARVAQPGSVSRRLEEPDRAEVDPGGIELVGRAAFHRCAAHDDVDHLNAAQITHDLSVDPGDDCKFTRPVIAVMWPGDPGRGVRLPFGGHAIAERSGKLAQRRGACATSRIILFHVHPWSTSRWVIAA